MYTLGIPTPVFAVLYFVAVALPVVLVRWRFSVFARTRGATAVEELEPYRLAYLADGTTRVGLTAVASLARRGVLRVTEDGVLRVSDALDVPGQPSAQAACEWSVLDVVRRAATPRAWWVAQELGKDPATKQLGEDLAERGLILSPRWISTRRWWWRGYYLALLPVGLLPPSGEDFAHREVRDLFYYLTFFALMGCVAFVLAGLPMSTVPVRTDAGEAVLRAAIHAEQQPSAEHAVAVDGMDGYPDPQLRELLQLSNSPPAD